MRTLNSCDRMCSPYTESTMPNKNHVIRNISSYGTYSTICISYPVMPVHCHLDCAIMPNSLPLEHTVIFFKYVIVNGKRFFASQTVGLNKSFLIHIVILGPSPKDAYGELFEILQINQDFQNIGYLLWFAWM